MVKTRAALVVASALGLSVLLAACGSGDSPSTARASGPVWLATHPTASMPPATLAEPTDATLRTLIDDPIQPGTMTVDGPHRDAKGSPRAHGRRFDVTYASGDLTLTAILDLPQGAGPFPAAVLVHGYFDPSAYDPDTNTDMRRQEAALVDAGYATLALNLRGYAGADGGTGFEDIDEVGFAQDVASAAVDLAAGAIRQIDPSRVALVGHSRGGRMVLDAAVLVPSSLRAVVAMSPTSVDLWDNIKKLNGDLLDNGGLGKFGNPANHASFWQDIDPATFAQRAAEPVLLIQGGKDEVLDHAWAPASVRAWRAGGGHIRLSMVPGANHNLDPAIDDVMRQTIDFLRANV